MEFISQLARRHAAYGCGVASLLMLLRNRDAEFSVTYTELADQLEIDKPVRNKWRNQYEDSGPGAYPADITRFLKNEGIPFLQIHDSPASSEHLMLLVKKAPLMIGMNWGKEGHWVVLQKEYRNGYRYLDPYKMPNEKHSFYISKDKLKKDWDGCAVQLLS